MARFITEKEGQNTHQPSSSLIHYVLLIIIIMEFTPLPDVPGTHFGPLYLIALLAALLMVFNFKKLTTVSPVIIKLVLLLLFLGVYEYVITWAVLDNFKEKFIDDTPFPTVRKCIELLTFAIACTNLSDLKRAILIIIIAIVIPTIIGILVYHFGEPFLSIRDWLLSSKIAELREVYSEGVPGKGGRLIGLSGTHWTFGYLMSAGPALALICGRLFSFKSLWAIIFLLFLYALHLNGERAALLGAIFSVTSLLIIWRLIKLPYIFIGLAIILSVAIFEPSSSSDRSIDPEATLTNRLSSSTSDMEFRLELWASGILSTLEHPLTGAKLREEYFAKVFGQERFIVVNNPDKRIVMAHNAYITQGVNIGVMGWFVVLFYLLLLKNLLTQVFKGIAKEKQEKVIFEGVSVVVIAPMINSFFQNESIFGSGEPTVICLTGLLISCYQIIYNRNGFES